MTSVNDIIEAVLAAEGSQYSDRGADAGGPTKYGITLTTLEAWRAHPCTAIDVSELTEDEAFAIYQRRYVHDTGFYQIGEQGLAGLAVDAAVQHGPQTAIELLQAAVGVGVDGKFGAVTLAAIERDPATAYRRLAAARIRLYGGLVAHDAQLQRAKLAGYSLQAENALGWANRIATFVEGTP